MEYANIVEKSDFYEFAGHDNLKLKTIPFPHSIKQKEFNYIHDYIVEHKLTKGFECATGTGISTLAAALAMKATGGKLVTMDAFSEETFVSYNLATPFVINKTSTGQKALSQLIDIFQLENHVASEVGWSPTDTLSSLGKHFDLSKDKLDFVFIDACHMDEAIKKDVAELKPYLSKTCAMFFHDLEIGGGITTHFKDWLQEQFGKTYNIIVPQPNGFNLGLLQL